MTEEAQAAPVAEEVTAEAASGEGAQEQQPSGAETLLAKDTGEKPDENGADGAGEQEDNTESQPETLELAVAEEFTAFADDFKSFQDDMAGWLKDNPQAGVKEALQEAANRQAKAVAEAKSGMEVAFKDQLKDWEKEARALPEIGGDKFDENLAVAKGALDAFGSPELTSLLNQSGYGSHPAVISMFVKAGAALKSAPVATNEKPSVSDEHSQRARYPSSFKE